MVIEAPTIELSRVEIGAQRLDAHFPDGWASQIDLETLTMESAFMCVLGQLSRTEGEHPITIRALFVTLGYERWQDSPFSWEVNVNLWRDEIAKRL